MLGSTLLQVTLAASRATVRPVTARAGRRWDGWSVAAQQQARRNAMVASTVLAQRRAERLEVEEFLAARLGRAAEGPRGLPTASTPARDVAHG